MGPTMLRSDRSIACVYLDRAPIDMRKQMDGIAGLVEGGAEERSVFWRAVRVHPSSARQAEDAGEPRRFSRSLDLLADFGSS